jgi:hypothetical protein
LVLTNYCSTIAITLTENFRVVGSRAVISPPHSRKSRGQSARQRRLEHLQLLGNEPHDVVFLIVRSDKVFPAKNLQHLIVQSLLQRDENLGKVFLVLRRNFLARHPDGVDKRLRYMEEPERASFDFSFAKQGLKYGLVHGSSINQSRYA